MEDSLAAPVVIPSEARYSSASRAFCAMNPSYIYAQPRTHGIGGWHTLSAWHSIGCPTLCGVCLRKAGRQRVGMLPGITRSCSASPLAHARGGLFGQVLGEHRLGKEGIGPSRQTLLQLQRPSDLRSKLSDHQPHHPDRFVESMAHLFINRLERFLFSGQFFEEEFPPGL